MIDVRVDNQEALRFKRACFVIDIRCESFEAINFMGAACLIDVFLRQLFTAVIYIIAFLFFILMAT